MNQEIQHFPTSKSL